MKNVFRQYVNWASYAPLDEREQQLYAKAYTRSFQTLVLLLIVSVGPLNSNYEELIALLNSLGMFARLGVIEGMLLVPIFISYISGARVFRGEGVSFQNRVRRGEIDWLMVLVAGVLAGTFTFVLQYWAM